MLQEDGPPPSQWTAGDAERAKRSFQNARPAVPKALVRDLLSYWLQHCPDIPLFGDTEDDLALVLHARAFGLTTQGGDDSLLTALTERALTADISGPLVSSGLVWGPNATLSPQVRAALASRVLRAWVAEDDRGPVDVLVIGAGISEIRREVADAALSACLQVNGLTDPASGFVADHVGIGAIHVTAGEQAAGPSIAFGGRLSRVNDGSLGSARGALGEFVALLRDLENRTCLVQVRVVRQADLMSSARGLRRLAERAASETDRAFLSQPADDHPQVQEVVSLQPYRRTAPGHGTRDRAGTSIALEFSPDLLTTSAYLRLEEAHQRVVAERLIIDAKLRRDRNQAEAERLEKDLEAFEEATPEERRAMWDPTVLITARFDGQTGISIRLAEPIEYSVDQYFKKVVPKLVKQYQLWAQSMSELVEFLEKAVSRSHAPARQIAAGRFIDAALRSAIPDESTATAKAFAAWSEEAAPALSFEWRCELRRQGILLGDVMTPHTVFVTRYLPPINDDQAILSVHPYTVVDSARSALLADAERKVIVVRDATDHGSHADSAATAADIGNAWDVLAGLAGKQGGQQEDFNQAFLALLRLHPGETVSRLIEELRPIPPGPFEMTDIDQELRAAQRLASASAGMRRAVTALSHGAYLTAREALSGVQEDAAARAWLLRAVVECVAADLGPEEIPEALGARLPGVPLEALRALDKAEGLDPDYSREWLRNLPDVRMLKAIRRLFLGLPRPRESCGTERRYAVWLFRHAIESARVARQLEQAADELPEDREDVDAVLTGLGRVLEDLLVGPFADGAIEEAEDLLAILTGRDQPKYGRAGAE